MKKTSIPTLFLLVLWAVAPFPRNVGAAEEALWLGDDERILLFATHPMDEVLSTGGLIQEALDLELPIQICIFTLGESEELRQLPLRRALPADAADAATRRGQRRREEAARAATELQLQPAHLTFMGYPDPGVYAIWCTGWQRTVPFLSASRTAKTPASGVRSPNTPYLAQNILDDIKGLIRDTRPTHVFVPHAADHHPDHWALHLFVRVAIWDLVQEGIHVEWLGVPTHFPDWPRPYAAEPETPMPLLEALDEDETAWMVFRLAPFQVENKEEAIRRYITPYRQSRPYLDAFLRQTERFAREPIQRIVPDGPALLLTESDLSHFDTDADFFHAIETDAARADHLRALATDEVDTLRGAENRILSRTFTVEADALILTVSLARPLAWNARAELTVFPYRTGTPFAQMPKLLIRGHMNGLENVQHLEQDIADSGVALFSPTQNSLEFEIPLSLLNHPDKLLSTIRLTRGDLTLDWTPWCALDIESANTLPPPHGEVSAPTQVDPPAYGLHRFMVPDASAPSAPPASAPAPEPVVPPGPAVAPQLAPKEKPAKTKPSKTKPPRTNNAADEIMSW